MTRSTEDSSAARRSPRCLRTAAICWWSPAWARRPMTSTPPAIGRQLLSLGRDGRRGFGRPRPGAGAARPQVLGGHRRRRAAHGARAASPPSRSRSPRNLVIVGDRQRPFRRDRNAAQPYRPRHRSRRGRRRLRLRRDRDDAHDPRRGQAAPRHSRSPPRARCLYVHQGDSARIRRDRCRRATPSTSRTGSARHLGFPAEIGGSMKIAMYIDVAWAAAPGTVARFERFNPYHRRSRGRRSRMEARPMSTAPSPPLSALRKGDWATLKSSQRGRLLTRLADLIDENAERLAAIEVQRQRQALSPRCPRRPSTSPNGTATTAGSPTRSKAPSSRPTSPTCSTSRRCEPLGVVAVITPWNSPLLLLAWKLAPALAAGNTVVIKPSEFTSASTLEFMQLFEEAGFPPGVVNTVTGFGGRGRRCRSSRIRGVAKIAFTGGGRQGRGSTRRRPQDLKHVSLELGGKSPNIVFDDAELESARQGRDLRHFRRHRADLHRRLAPARCSARSTTSFVERLRRGRAQAARSATRWTPTRRSGRSRPSRSTDKVLDYIDIAQEGGRHAASWAAARYADRARAAASSSSRRSSPT